MAENVCVKEIPKKDNLKFFEKKIGSEIPSRRFFPRTQLKIAIVAYGKFLEPKGINRTIEENVANAH